MSKNPLVVLLKKSLIISGIISLFDRLFPVIQIKLIPLDSFIISDDMPVVKKIFAAAVSAQKGYCQNRGSI